MSTQEDYSSTLKGYSNQGVLFKMGKDLRNHILISSSSGPRILWGESTENLIFRHTKDKKVTGNRQHKLSRRKSCQFNLVTFL